MSEQEVSGAAIADDVHYNLASFMVGGVYPYQDQATQMYGKTVFHINHFDLNDRIAKELLEKPQEIMPQIREGVLMLVRDVLPSYHEELKETLEVQIHGLEPTIEKRLDLENLKHFVCVEGKIHSIEKVRQITKSEMHVKCSGCKFDQVVTKHILKCTSCGSDEIEFYDEDGEPYNQRFIELVLEEDNEIAESVWLALRGSLVDSDLDIGETIQASGVVRMAKSREKDIMDDVKVNFLYLDVNCIERKTSKTVITLTDTDRQELRQWAETHPVVDFLTEAFAPHIYGEDFIKECLLYQIVGAEIDGVSERPDTHILILGDPSTGKTELGLWAVKVGNGIFQSAEGINKVGIGAGLVKNEITGRWMVQGGIAVLGHMKLKVLDEIDKIPDKSYYNELYTIMEKGFYTMRKIRHKDMETKGPWLITGNPKHGKYDPYSNINENINFPLPLLTRFDLIFVMRRLYEKAKSQKKLDKMKGKYLKQEEKTLDIEFQTKYLMLAKEITNIEYEPEVFTIIDTYYHKLESSTDHDDYQGIPITERQYHGMVRLATARAKLHLRNKVLKEDAERAITIVQDMLGRIGIDVQTGKIDINVLQGKPASRAIDEKLFKMVCEGLDMKRNDVGENIIVEQLVKTGKFTEESAKKILADKQLEGVVMQASKGFWKFV